ncbi:glyoxalase superfamily protein [Roseovarius aestuarii]|nr:glyoxalase superfamily protein [Roseovarius aestuarii]
MPNAPALKPPVPILRSFDAQAARAFYLDFLGFSLLFEHRFDPDAPLYMGLTLGACELHISEHHGDATPGSALRIELADVHAYCKLLNAKQYQNARPAVQHQDWGWDDMIIADPAGNRLIFCTRHQQ